MPEKITIEKLAEMSQREFASIQSEFKAVRAEMATKGDLRNIRNDMEEGFKNLREDIKADFREAVREIRDEVKKVNYSVEIDGLRNRVQKLEQKVGIARG